MEVVYERIAAIDIGKRQSVVYIGAPSLEATRSAIADLVVRSRIL